AGHGIERGTSPDHPAPDDQDVDLGLAHLVDHVVPGCRGQFSYHRISRPSRRQRARKRFCQPKYLVTGYLPVGPFSALTWVRSRLRSSLPTLVRGRAGTTRTSRGYLVAASRARAGSTRPAGVPVASGPRATNAPTSSPSRGSGRPTAAAWA